MISQFIISAVDSVTTIKAPDPVSESDKLQLEIEHLSTVLKITDP